MALNRLADEGNMTGDSTKGAGMRPLSSSRTVGRFVAQWVLPVLAVAVLFMILHGSTLRIITLHSTVHFPSFLYGSAMSEWELRMTELTASYAQVDIPQPADGSRQRDGDLTLAGLASGLPAGVLTNASAWLAYTNGLSPDRLIKAEEIKRNYVAVTLALQALDEAQRKWQQEHGTAHPHIDGVASTDRRDAETLMVGIRPGMTLGQTGKAVPHISMTDSGVYEHGGDWYDIAINEDLTIQIRVAHRPEGTTAENSAINFSPRLRNRKTHEFLAGQEEPW